MCWLQVFITAVPLEGRKEESALNSSPNSDVSPSSAAPASSATGVLDTATLVQQPEDQPQPQPQPSSGAAARVCIEFRVKDHGLGVPPEKMNRLFKEFMQGIMHCLFDLAQFNPPCLTSTPTLDLINSGCINHSQVWW